MRLLLLSFVTMIAACGGTNSFDAGDAADATDATSVSDIADVDATITPDVPIDVAIPWDGDCPGLVRYPINRSCRFCNDAGPAPFREVESCARHTSVRWSPAMTRCTTDIPPCDSDAGITSCVLRIALENPDVLLALRESGHQTACPSATNGYDLEIDGRLIHIDTSFTDDAGCPPTPRGVIALTELLDRLEQQQSTLPCLVVTDASTDAADDATDATMDAPDE